MASYGQVFKDRLPARLASSQSALLETVLLHKGDQRT